MKKSAPMNNSLIVALDVDTRERALKLATDLGDIVGGFKLGPRLCLRYGMDLVKEIAKHGPVFMDNKHFDIPSTMEAAVRASFEAGASLVTVHALSGMEALTLMGKVEKELNQTRPFRILAVTVLTSWDEKSLPSNMKSQPVADHVVEMAKQVHQAGVSGLVCSAHELTLLKDIPLYKVTPGIRFELQASQDQKRTMTPTEALKAGASALVVGRPIVEAKNPKEAAMDFTVTAFE